MCKREGERSRRENQSLSYLLCCFLPPRPAWVPVGLIETGRGWLEKSASNTLADHLKLNLIVTSIYKQSSYSYAKVSRCM